MRLELMLVAVATATTGCESEPARPGGPPTLQIDATQRRASSPQAGLQVALPKGWVISPTPTPEGVGMAADHGATRAMCSLGLALVSGRTLKELIQAVSWNGEGGAATRTEFDGRLGEAAARGVRVHSQLDGADVVVEVRFVKQGENFVAASCMHTVFPDDGLTVQWGKGGPPIEDPRGGANATSEFFNAIKLPAN